MKTLRQICVAVILTMALAISVLGGDIHCPAATSPAPGGTSPSASITTTVILTIISLIR